MLAIYNLRKETFRTLHAFKGVPECNRFIFGGYPSDLTLPGEKYFSVALSTTVSTIQDYDWGADVDGVRNPRAPTLLSSTLVNTTTTRAVFFWQPRQSSTVKRRNGHLHNLHQVHLHLRRHTHHQHPLSYRATYCTCPPSILNNSSHYSNKPVPRRSDRTNHDFRIHQHQFFTTRF